MHIRSMNVCVDQSFALVCLWCCICTSQVLETVEQINSIKLQREFYLGFSQNPQKFINDWLASQSRDLKVRGWCASWTDVRPSVHHVIIMYECFAACTNPLQHGVLYIRIAEEFYYLDDSCMPKNSQSILHSQRFAHMGFIRHIIPHQ